MSIAKIWKIEIGTFRHKIAQQTLFSKGKEKDHPDIEIFTDNGSIDLAVLYEDMCRANSKKINKEENDRLKI